MAITSEDQFSVQSVSNGAIKIRGSLLLYTFLLIKTLCTARDLPLVEAAVLPLVEATVSYTDGRFGRIGRVH